MEVKEVIKVAIRFLRDVLGLSENRSIDLEEVFSPQTNEEKHWYVTLSYYANENGTISTLFNGNTKIYKKIEIDDKTGEVITLRSRNEERNTIS